jgi:hypothetical protein
MGNIEVLAHAIPAFPKTIETIEQTKLVEDEMNTMTALAGKVVIVTGGRQGMGAATTKLLTEQGAHAVVADIAEDAGSSLVAELGDATSFFRLDVTSEMIGRLCLYTLSSITAW